MLKNLHKVTNSLIEDTLSAWGPYKGECVLYNKRAGVYPSTGSTTSYQFAFMIVSRNGSEVGNAANCFSNGSNYGFLQKNPGAPTGYALSSRYGSEIRGITLRNGNKFGGVQTVPGASNYGIRAIASEIGAAVPPTTWNSIVTTYNNKHTVYCYLNGVSGNNGIYYLDSVMDLLDPSEKRGTWTGFFYKAGYYKNGYLINDGSYIIVSCNSSKTDFGTSKGPFKNLSDGAAALSGNSDYSSYSEDRFILLQLTGKSYPCYKTLCGTFDKPVNYNTIRNYCGATSGSSGAGAGGSAAASVIDQLTEESYFDVNNTLNNATGGKAQSYIKNFQDYKMVFIGNSALASEINVDRNNLIVSITKDTIPATSGGQISDKYISLYYNANKDENYTEANQDGFFSQIDSFIQSSVLTQKQIPNYSSTSEREHLKTTVIGVDKQIFNDFMSSPYWNKGEFSLSVFFDHIPSSANIYSLTQFMNKTDRTKKLLMFFDVENNLMYKSQEDIETFMSDNSSYFTNIKKTNFEISLEYNQESEALNLYSLELFEGYTRGRDFIQEDYTTVRAEEYLKSSINGGTNNKRKMSMDDNYFLYKYSGRDFQLNPYNESGSKNNKVLQLSGGQDIYCVLVHSSDLLLESDVTLGEAYGIQNYFIQAIRYDANYNIDNEIAAENMYHITPDYHYVDTFKVTNYLEAILDDPTAGATKYTEDDLEIKTGNIDLTQCKYFNPLEASAENHWCDCSYGGNGFQSECLYVKIGKCPYRFKTEKHPRRIRTLSKEKSNRFNLIQELSKVFEVYPNFYIEFNENGKVKTDEDGKMLKHICFMTEKGNLQKVGFRYERNLSNISRTVDSSSITTKLYVENIDSQLTPTGVCSIETAEDSISRTNYIIGFDYYIKKGILNAEQVQRDLYGISKNDMAFLPTIGYFNKRYDDLSNLIINMTGEKLTELAATLKVSVTGVGTALEERQKVAQQMYQFKTKAQNRNTDYTTSDTYKNYLEKYKAQATILWGEIEKLFFTGSNVTLINRKKNETTDEYEYDFQLFTMPETQIIGTIYPDDKFGQMKYLANAFCEKYCKGELFYRLMIHGFENEDLGDIIYTPVFNSWEDFKDSLLEDYQYPVNGNEGQYKGLYDQVKRWKTERATWLNKINAIADKFYKKYEPFIKEGTWTDSNYLTDNEYYWAAQSVLEDGSKPKITYNISVVDIAPLPWYTDDYTVGLGDTTFIEDIDFFGINKVTGLPNREKVIIKGITFSLDQPQQNSISISTYSTAFEDLFGSINASVQSLTFNENTYKRASNFTATKYVEKEALQGTLDEGDLILMNANNNNIEISEDGTKGRSIDNKSNCYDLRGEGLFFSQDGGVTWDIGVGPSGINADYIKFGQLDASKIQIVDGSYIYFLWDKSGINAYRNPATSTSGLVDFARFNKYGLSLIENNNVRLRAGYAYSNNNNNGDYREENELTNQHIGFYLYNDKGQPIFKTETRSDYDDVNSDYSARLSLAGEIFATNKVLAGENDGSIISSKIVYKYYTSYAIRTVSFGRLGPLSQSIISNLIGQDWYIEDRGTEVVVYVNIEQFPTTSSCEFYTTDTTQVITSGFRNGITPYQIITDSYIITNVTSTTVQDLTDFLNSATGTITKADLQAEFPDIQDYALGGMLVYSVYNGQNYYYAKENMLALTGITQYDPDNVVPNSFIKTTDNINAEQVSCYDIRTVLETGSGAITFDPNGYTLYSTGGTYWLTKEETSETEDVTTTGVSTSDVGIFINNKLVGQTSITDEDLSNIRNGNYQEYDASFEVVTNTGGYSEGGLPAIINAAKEVIKAAHSVDSSLTYSHGYNYNININGVSTPFRPDCSGYIEAVVHALGYDVGNFWAGGTSSRVDISKNGASCVDGTGTKDWLLTYDATQVSNAINNPQMGDIFITEGHMGMFVYKSGTSPLGFDFGGTDNAQASYEFAVAIDNTGLNQAMADGKGYWTVPGSGYGTVCGLLRFMKGGTAGATVTSPFTSSNFYVIGDSLTYGISTSDIANKGNFKGIVGANFQTPPSQWSTGNISSATEIAFAMGRNCITDSASQYATFIQSFLSAKNMNSVKKVYLIPVISPDDVSSADAQLISAFNSNLSSVDINGIDVIACTELESQLTGLPGGGDGIHLNAEGYKQAGTNIVNYFTQAYGSNNTSSYTITRNVSGAINTILSGSERLFSIALGGEKEGKTVYNNLLTILKNGVLYMGGEIKDYNGRDLSLKSFEYMPDEISIKDAPIILTNDGNVWMDFNRIYAIKNDGQYTGLSLMDCLVGASGGDISQPGSEGGSINRNTNVPEEFYTVDFTDENTYHFLGTNGVHDEAWAKKAMRCLAMGEVGVRADDDSAHSLSQSGLLIYPFLVRSRCLAYYHTVPASQYQENGLLYYTFTHAGFSNNHWGVDHPLPSGYTINDDNFYGALTQCNPGYEMNELASSIAAAAPGMNYGWSGYGYNNTESSQESITAGLQNGTLVPRGYDGGAVTQDKDNLVGAYGNTTYHASLSL